MLSRIDLELDLMDGQAARLSRFSDGRVSMTIRIKAVLAGAAAAFVALAAPVAMAEDPLTAYTYTYYADAAKTQVLGQVSDQGCGQVGGFVYVIRANIPSPYYDAEPIYVCTGGGPILPGD
jgi:hypothetical protein